MAKKKKRWWKIILIIAVVLILAILILGNLGKKDTAIEVMADKTSMGILVQTVSGTGRVQPEIQVKISANVSGRIIELAVKEGDQVKKGDLLVKLDKERYEAVVEQARSSQKSAEAALAKSRSELNRIAELNQRGMASESDLEAAQAEFQLRSAEVEQTAAGLKQAQDDLSKTIIFAPMEGVVSQLNKEVGEIALGAQFQEDVILVVADLSKMEVLIEVDENDIVNVALQDTARLKIDAYPDTTFKGQVREIAHTATTRGAGTAEELTNFQVKIAMLEVPPTLRPGMSATADVVTEVRDTALRIPVQAVVLREAGGKRGKGQRPGKDKTPPDSSMQADSSGQEQGKKDEPIEVVFRIDHGVARQVPVITGISSETDIEILSGLAEGDSIVTGPFRTLSQKLKDGDKIKISQPGRGGSKRGGQENMEMIDEM